MAETDPHKLTWAALLGRWVDFARSALALPDNAEGRAWRDAVPEIIGLQALAMALAEAEQLDPEQRALAIDRSRILHRRHVDRLSELFGDDPDQWHPMLLELAQDAERAIEQAERLNQLGDPHGNGDPTDTPPAP